MEADALSSVLLFLSLPPTDLCTWAGKCTGLGRETPCLHHPAQVLAGELGANRRVRGARTLFMQLPVVPATLPTASLRP